MTASTGPSSNPDTTYAPVLASSTDKGTRRRRASGATIATSATATPAASGRNDGSDASTSSIHAWDDANAAPSRLAASTASAASGCARIQAPTRLALCITGATLTPVEAAHIRP